MTRRSPWIAFALALLLVTPAPADARPTVRRLPLPRDATIDAFGSRALVSIAPNGTVAATITLHGYASRVILWNRAGGYRVLPGSATVASFAPSGALLVDAGRPERVRPNGQSEPLDFHACEAFPQLSTGPLVTGRLANGALVATMLSPRVVNLDDTSGQTAPVVLYLRSGQCFNLGNGIALGTAGNETAGYAAYIDGVAAPSNVFSSKERVGALRWDGRTRNKLGPGVAIAVNPSGTCAGADALPGYGIAYATAPHAMVWPVGGGSLALAPAAPLSVAYAVDARGRVTGMLEDRNGRHEAFLWENGRLRLLDDVIGSPGWHFETGYAFAPDGAIAGIGIYRGAPAVFEVDGL